VRPGRAANHSHPSSAAVMEEYSFTSTHPLGHTGPVTGSLYLLPLEMTFSERQTSAVARTDYDNIKVKVKVKVKVNFTLEQTTKAQTGSRGIALLILLPRRYI